MAGIDHQNYTRAVQEIFNLLLGLNLGTPGQRRAGLRSLWSTYLPAWLSYTYFGDLGDAQSIDQLIAVDVTHAWLDNVVGGQTIRQGIIDRLNARGV